MSASRIRKRLLIVDGYNVLRSGQRYRLAAQEGPDYTDDAFNKARELLINDVVAYVGNDMQAVVVFDGADNDVARKSQSFGVVRVEFSPVGQSADKVIERLAHDARARGVETMVVTSDATIQDTVFGGGVDRMSANGFSREMESYDEEVRAESRPAATVKRTLGERLSPEALEKLRALRDQG